MDLNSDKCVELHFGLSNKIRTCTVNGGALANVAEHRHCNYKCMVPEYWKVRPSACLWINVR